MEAKVITREQAIASITFNMQKLTDREVRMVCAFIQGLKYGPQIRRGEGGKITDKFGDHLATKFAKK